MWIPVQEDFSRFLYVADVACAMLWWGLDGQNVVLISFSSQLDTIHSNLRESKLGGCLNQTDW